MEDYKLNELPPPVRKDGKVVWELGGPEVSHSDVAGINKQMLDDDVNHPARYTQGGIECIDALAAATYNKSGLEAVCTANIIKYLWRYELKDGRKDILKAQWYLNKLLEIVK